jgi:hypothetical protein
MPPEAESNAGSKLAPAHRPRVFDGHLADLRKSGLSDDTIALMRVRSLDATELTAALGYAPDGVQSALALPYLGLDFVRYRLFPPGRSADGHAIRYLQASGSAVHLYILPAVRAVLTDVSVPICWTEGEKKAAKATQDGFPCVGLGGLWNWLEAGTANGIEELDAILHVEREQIIVPDSDVWTRPDLLQAVYAFGKELEARGACVAVVIVPPGESGAKVGLDDFLVAHGADAFRGLKRIPLKHAAFTKQKEWFPGWKQSRAQAADNLKQGQGTALTLADPEPWSEPVDDAELLDALAARYKQHLVLPSGAADALALWTESTHCSLDCFDSPYFIINSPMPQCGKSRTLDVAECVVHRPMMTTSLTPATLYRIVEMYHPTLLIDEHDADPEMKQTLRGLLNAGNRPGVRVPRCVGDTHEVRLFDLFCPKAIAGIGRLHATTEDRSILVQMRRRKEGEHVERFRRDRAMAECEPLRRKAARWAQDHAADLRVADPQMPEELSDRGQDKWRILIAIADCVGGEWPARARAAARKLSETVDDEEVRVQLLSDIRDVFVAHNTDRLASETIVGDLVKLEHRPWPEMGKLRKPMTTRGLAALLKPFDITSKTVRLSPTETPKGYDRADFDDAFSRYLPAENATTPQPAPGLEKGQVLHPPQAGECGASGNATSPYSDKACGGVADTREVVEL